MPETDKFVPLQQRLQINLGESLAASQKMVENLADSPDIKRRSTQATIELRPDEHQSQLAMVPNLAQHDDFHLKMKEMVEPE